MPTYPETPTERRRPTSSTAKRSLIPIAGWRTGNLPRPGCGPTGRTRSPSRTSPPFRAASGSAAGWRSCSAIGVLGTPTPVRGRYFYSAGTGSRTSRCSTGGRECDGADRVAVDPNALNAAGTTALDWYYPSEDGRLLAYGLSENGSEESVLHILDLETGRHLPDTIARMRAASLAWLPDATRLLLHPVSRPGEVPAGEEQYHRAIYFHRLGTDPAADPLVFQPAEKEHWPGVERLPRWPLAARSAWPARSIRPIFTSRISPAGLALVASREGSAGIVRGEIAHGRLFLRTNLDAPTYRLYRGRS